MIQRERAVHRPTLSSATSRSAAVRVLGCHAAGMCRTVLHVSETMDGGVGVVLSQLVEAQAARGWRVVVVAPRSCRLVGVVAGSGGAWMDWQPGARPGPRLPLQVATVGRAVREQRPDLVHLHSSMAGLCGRLAVRARIPTVFQPHAWSFFAVGGSMAQVALCWERFGSRWSSAVLCVSHEERAHAVRVGLRARFEVVLNGVDLTRFSPLSRGEARVRLGLDDAPLAVCVGRLHRQKGQHRLLDAWPEVLSCVPEARLALVGDGPDRQGLEARSAQRTRVVGQTDDVAAWLAAADVVVQPSLWEGMSLAVLEAMAAGRSLVVTDVPGMAEVVQPGAGAVVPLGDAHQLALALVSRLTDPVAAAAEGARGRAMVVRNHDLKVQVQKVMELADELIGRPR